jgi:hypothetical protein
MGGGNLGSAQRCVHHAEQSRRFLGKIIRQLAKIIGCRNSGKYYDRGAMYASFQPARPTELGLKII